VAHEVPGQSDFDAAAAVNAEIEARIAQLNFAAEFEAAGESYSELDENGQVVTRNLPTKSP
jgi:hypothetical protein